MIPEHLKVRFAALEAEAMSLAGELAKHIRRVGPESDPRTFALIGILHYAAEALGLLASLPQETQKG